MTNDQKAILALTRENAALAARLAEAEALLRGAQYQPDCATESKESWWAAYHDFFDTADSATLNMEPAPDGSRVLCVADQPTACATCNGKGYVPRNNPLHPFTDKRCPDCGGDQRTPP